MSELLFASVPIHGHVAPLLPIVRSLVARGDRVRFLTGARFADAVTATGAEFVALPDAADFDDRTVTGRFPEREALSPVKAIAFDFEHIFVRPAEHQLAAVRRLVAAQPTDAIVCDPLFIGGALYVQAHEVRPPVIVAGIVPLNLPGPGLAPFGLGMPPLGGPAGALRNGLLRTITGRLFRDVQAAADEIAVRTGGRPLSGQVLDWLGTADVVCQLTVPSFEYPRPDIDEHVVFTGPIVSDAAASDLPDWWDDLDGSRPVVHVTQGTIANDDPTELIVPTIRALAEEDVLVVVATGGTPVAALGVLPANVRAAEFVPYDALFERTDVFVTNGGYGGVQFSLRHGVPLVVAPGKEDKVEVAARVAWSGAGVNLRTQRPSEAALARAIRSVLRTPAHRAVAERISNEMAQASGAPGFAAAVDVAIARRRGQSSSSSRGLRYGSASPAN